MNLFTAQKFQNLESLWENVFVAQGYEGNGPIWHNLELIIDFMDFLVSCKFDEYPIKN